MSDKREVRAIDANALLDDLQELLNQEVLGNTISDVGVGIEIAMYRINRAKETMLNTLRDAIYEDAVAHGLWDKTDGPIGCSFLVSEEATELVNAGNEVQLARCRFSDDETEAWGNYVEELADVIIASLSVAGKLGIDIDAAVRRKMEINKARPWKHGKDEQGKS